MSENRNKQLGLDRLQLELGPSQKRVDEVFAFHEFACAQAPLALKSRPKSAFINANDYAIVRVTPAGTQGSLVAGSVALFQETEMTFELGGLFSAVSFRSYGLAQLMTDATIVKWWDENNPERYPEAQMIARVKYGNKAPLKLLKRAGFQVTDVDPEKVHFRLAADAPAKAAIRLYDAIIKFDAIVDENLFASIFETIRKAQLKK